MRGLISPAVTRSFATSSPAFLEASRSVPSRALEKNPACLVHSTRENCTACGRLPGYLTCFSAHERVFTFLLMLLAFLRRGPTRERGLGTSSAFLDDFRAHTHTRRARHAVGTIERGDDEHDLYCSTRGWCSWWSFRWNQRSRFRLLLSRVKTWPG